MTHDDLLKKMYLPFKNAEDAEFFGLSKYRTALIAVMELHKPSLVNAEECETCTLHTDYSDRYIAYPCETIQAIEKELS